MTHSQELALKRLEKLDLQNRLSRKGLSRLRELRNISYSGEDYDLMQGECSEQIIY